MSVRSMTGFGAASRPYPADRGDGGHLDVEIRALNGRFLEVKVRQPFGGAVEQRVRRLVERRLGRGRVDVAISSRTASSDGADLASLGLAEDSVRAGLRGLRVLARIADEEGVELLPPTQAEVLRVLLAARSAPEQPSEAPPVLDALLEEALDQLCAFREREGDHLAQTLASLCSELEQQVSALQTLLPGEHQRRRDRIDERLATFVRDASGAGPEPERLAQELAMILARTDIAEELARIASHLGQVRQVLAAPAKKGQGKTLDFLSQELMRELTTVGSKIASHDGSTLVIEAKAVVERMREQVQNVE